MLVPSALSFIVNAGWQASLIAILAALCGWQVRGAPARLRHGLYVGALVAAALIPLISVACCRPTAWAESGARPWPRPVALPSLVLNAHAGAGLLVLAGLAIGLRLARLGVAIWRTRSSALSRVEGPGLALARRTAEALGAGRFQLFSSSLARGPFSVGRRVVVPNELLRPESSGLLRAALGHELAHLRRHDFAVNLALELLVVPLAFHPAIWFLKRRADDLCELACDEAVIEAGLEEPAAYAQSLLSLARAALASRGLGFAMGAVAPPLLEERIRVLVERPVSPPLGRTAAALSAMAAAALLCTAFAIPASLTTDWLTRGLASCRAGDAAGADEAVDHLNEFERADLLLGCAEAHWTWCDDRGFHPEETP